MQQSRTDLQRLGKLLLALTAAAALGACASIPRRAWENGRSLSYQNDAYSVMRGDFSLRTQRDMYWSATPLHYQQRPSSGFQGNPPPGHQ